MSEIRKFQNQMDKLQEESRHTGKQFASWIEQMQQSFDRNTTEQVLSRWHKCKHRQKKTAQLFRKSSGARCHNLYESDKYVSEDLSVAIYWYKRVAELGGH